MAVACGGCSALSRTMFAAGRTDCCRDDGPPAAAAGPCDGVDGEVRAACAPADSGGPPPHGSCVSCCWSKRPALSAAPRLPPSQYCITSRSRTTASGSSAASVSAMAAATSRRPPLLQQQQQYGNSSHGWGNQVAKAIHNTVHCTKVGLEAGTARRVVASRPCCWATSPPDRTRPAVCCLLVCVKKTKLVFVYV